MTAPEHQGWRRGDDRDDDEAGEPRPGALYRLLDGVSDGVAEVVLGAIACGLGFLALAGLRWGWSRHPASTAVVLALLALSLAYGAWSLWQAHRGQRRARGPLAAVAATAAVAVGLWLLYLLTYCPCVAGP